MSTLKISKENGLRPSGTFESLFNDWFEDFGFPMWAPVLPSRRLPAMDVEDKGDHYEIKVDLPGIDKKDVKVSVEGNLLTVEGHSEEKKEQGKAGSNYYRMERSSGDFLRQIRLPEDVKMEGSQGRMDKGVLMLTLPKVKSTKAETKNIPIA